MRTLAFASLLVLFLGYAHDAGALDGSAAVLGGLGLTSQQADDAPPPVGYGLALGARAGIALSDIYLGGTFVHHFGASYEGRNSNVWYTGAEAGYHIHAGQLTVRPYLGAGYARTHIEGPLWCQTTGPCWLDGRSASMGALWPGATAFADLGSHFFAGLDARYVILLNGLYESGISVFITGGVGF
jgi:hypothetical protein